MKMGSQYLAAGREEVATEVFVSSLWATDASGTGAASLKIPRLHFTSRDLQRSELKSWCHVAYIHC